MQCSPKHPAQVAPKRPTKVAQLGIGHSQDTGFHHMWAHFGLGNQAGIWMADSLVETFTKEKWLNSTNDIIKLKCPNSVEVFSVSTLRIIIEVKNNSKPSTTISCLCGEALCP